MIVKNPLESTPTRLECDGLSLRDVAVPPFRLRKGQSVCLHVSLPSPTWYEELLPLLTGRRAHPSLRFFGTVAYLERPNPRRRWWGGWYDPSVGHWLTVERKLTSSEALSVLSVLDLPWNLPIGRIGWNERTLLTLEVNLLNPPDLLLFDTSGNDSLTESRVFERLSSRSQALSLIYLKTHRGTDSLCLPGSSCLEIAHTPFTPLYNLRSYE